MRVEENFDLSALNTFRMKVRCARYIEYDSEAELKSIPWDELPRPVKHIGAGSNLLFEKDFPGTILHSRIRYIKYFDVGADKVPVAVGAGVVFDDFVAKACADGFWGVENLSLIPGEVGASAVQNIGAYGAEVGDVIAGVVCYDTVKHEKCSFKQAECHYGYRDSFFKHADGRYIVTSVLFRLDRNYSPKTEYKGVREALEAAGLPVPGTDNAAKLTPSQVREAIIGIRRIKLPDPAETGSAGSFFKNPVIGREQYSAFLTKVAKTLGPEVQPPHFDLPDGSVKVPAAWLIDRCGFKGAENGGAAVYRNQPLVIVNASGEASPEDIIGLEKRIIDGVRSTFGIELHPEVEHI